jgi:phosphoenolpyruvate carboxykinase (GTP)
MTIPEPAHTWIAQLVPMLTPARIHWMDGSEEERALLEAHAVQEGVLLPLDPVRNPRSYLHRSRPDDTARTEQVTFICSEDPSQAGPTGRWWAPEEARAELGELLQGAMSGRTMYVVPFLLGPPGSPFARVGVQVTDSVYVALSLRIMTRVGKVAWDAFPADGHFTRCVHALRDLDPAHRAICHFPEQDTVWSVGSGYGGNALLPKKCVALRLASVRARDDGWLAEHMLILAVQAPGAPVRYVAAAFPSQCGKTNLAMVTPPPALARKGWRTWTVGDDIAWLRPGADGRLWAVNPEAGFFGVAPGTSHATNPVAMRSMAHDTIFTNVALRADGTPWWEGHDEPPGAGLLDWQGRPCDGHAPAAHPNARFTAPLRNCPNLSPHAGDPQGVPIDAILFGARRPTTMPLVCEARDWTHGVFLGATLCSETTAAATGPHGELRHDPMAMLPFLGYHLGDYLQHWLDVGRRLTAPPRIFGVNWFRRTREGAYAWPGYGENLRVVGWALDRADGRHEGTRTPFGTVPAPGELDTEGLVGADLTQAMAVDPNEARAEAEEQRRFILSLAERCPGPMRTEAERLHAEANAGGKVLIPT